MKLRVVLEITVPDDVARAVIDTAGGDLKEGDEPTALALVVMRPCADALRSLLLAPEHVPIAEGVPTRITTERSAFDVDITLSSVDENSTTGL